MEKTLVSIVMGSESDMPQMEKAADILRDFGVVAEVRILSAHRSPDDTAEFARKAAQRGIKVIIAGAGGAAHLAGVIASYTLLPVIGVPMDSSALSGIDSLFSTVQMPAGIPVGTVGVGKSGAANAALLALRILGITDNSVRKKLDAYRDDLCRKARAADRRVRGKDKR